MTLGVGRTHGIKAVSYASALRAMNWIGFDRGVRKFAVVAWGRTLMAVEPVHWCAVCVHMPVGSRE